MAATTISVFRVTGARARAWAFGQMLWARRPLARAVGPGFWKLFGTGGGESFRARPNLGVWGILATWPSEAAARRGLAEVPVFQRYRARAEESFTVFLQATSARGAWDGRRPFEAEATLASGAPVAILTRATVKPAKAWAFWQGAPDIDGQTAREPAILFKMGMGEMPFLRQVTFSIWSDLEAMTAFAYRHPFHREAARLARERAWFAEELFARFAVLGAEGNWGGRNPLAEISPAPRPEPARLAEAI